MSKLIQQFLETHRQCAAQGSVFNISPTLDQEALAIIEQAQTETQARSKGKEATQQQKIFNKALDARLTRLLDKIDLLNAMNYTTLRNAIHRWLPWQPHQHQVCLQVQKNLLTLLPVARQKQELRQLCQEYKNYLAVEVEKEAKADSAQNYFVSTNSQTLLFGASPVEHDLCLISADTEPKKGKLYLKNINGYIAYTVMTPKGETVRDIQTQIKAPLTFDLDHLASRKDDILEITSKSGHTSPVHERAQVTRVNDSRPPMEKLTSEPTRTIGKPDQPLSLTIQKYQAVNALQATLSTPVKSAPEQMKDFRAQFKIQRPVIEQDRDSWAMKFAKGVATVLSLGVAWLCGIWNVKGQEAVNGLQTTLDKPLPPIGTCRVG